MMTGRLAAALCEPIEDDAPCGPDLDLAYDPEYSLFVARADGIVPQKFFEFVRTDHDLAKECRTIETLLGRTRDLRLLILLAKFRILNRELGGFVEALAAMAALMRAHWNEVHPAADEGDFGLRIVVVESLDDMASVVMPLVHVPLTTSRRSGPVHYRAVQIAQGEATAQEGEATLDMSAIEAAFNDGELPQIVENRDLVVAALTALAEMDESVDEHGAGSLALGKVKPILVKMRTMLDGVIVRRDPSAVVSEPSTDGSPSESAPATGSLPLDDPGAVRRALLGAELYFQKNEPSSPALLLVAQARHLVGKSLAESVQLLVPDHSEKAVINVGGRLVFELPIERLATLLDGQDAAEATEDAHPPVPASRREALDILLQVANHVRIREPSSAIPLLCERARSLAERDFMSLLREMLPNGAFRNLDDD
jgi:type VI secretion system protein ImpA